MAKLRIRFPKRRIRSSHDALATLSCGITIVHPQPVTTPDYGDTTAQEEQAMEKMIHALQENLETPLVQTGWKPNSARTARQVKTPEQVETQLHFDNRSYANTPFVVNIVVDIRATPQVTEELKRIDWAKIICSSD
jgi:hypothetical protein